MTTPKVHAEVLRKLLRAGAMGRVERLIDRLHASDVAQILPELDPSELRTVYDVLFSAHRAARTLRELPGELLPLILDVLDDGRVGKVLSRLPPDDAVAFLHALPEERRARVTSDLPSARQRELERLLAFPEATAGSVMTTR
ncbi:MAG: magnesium transporter MgtE N-terminal domain-containing protein, partial [Candidatus Binatia bacterium]